MSLFGVGAKEARARIERARSQVPEAFGAKDVLSKRDVKFAALHLHPDKCSLKHDAETCTALFKDVQPIYLEWDADIGEGESLSVPARAAPGSAPPRPPKRLAKANPDEFFLMKRRVSGGTPPGGPNTDPTNPATYAGVHERVYGSLLAARTLPLREARARLAAGDMIRISYFASGAESWAQLYLPQKRRFCGYPHSLVANVKHVSIGEWVGDKLCMDLVVRVLEIDKDVTIQFVAWRRGEGLEQSGAFVYVHRNDAANAQALLSLLPNERGARARVSEDVYNFLLSPSQACAVAITKLAQ